MRKKDVKTKEDLIQYYEKVRVIKFADYIEINNIQDIYENLIKVKNPTYYVRGKLQCKKGKYRSFDDFIKLYKYYFRNKTLVDFRNELKNFINDNNDSPMGYIEKILYCPYIKKDNFRGFDWLGTPMLEHNFTDSTFPNCNVILNEL